MKDYVKMKVVEEKVIYLMGVDSKSLDEVNGSVWVFKDVSFWWILIVYIGLGVLVVVGYMDFGNWIILIVGGL